MRILGVLFILFSYLLSGTVVAQASQPKGIILVGNPRGLTTAFERYMINRGDFKVYHEPIVTHTYSKLYPASFKSSFKADCSNDCVLQQIFSENEGSFFVKEIASFVVDNKALRELVKDNKVQIIFLIRKPEQAVLSHYKLRSTSPWKTEFNTTEYEVNYAHMLKLFRELKTITNKTPILIDADDLLNNPKLVLNKLCSMLGLSFKDKDLQWQSGESSLWANDVDTWQYNVTNSTGFKSKPKSHSLNDIPLAQRTKLQKLIEHNNRVYIELAKYKI